jgi:biopolymer transport protein ExbD
MAGSVGSEDGDIGFQIAPMVDVVFVLMIFFMAMAGQKVNEQELNISLPSGSTGSSTERTPIVIDISAEGQVTVNASPLGTPADKSLMALQGWLKNAMEFGKDDPVIIRPNPETRHERVVDVLNAAAAAGVKNLSFS